MDLLLLLNRYDLCYNFKITLIRKALLMKKFLQFFGLMIMVIVTINVFKANYKMGLIFGYSYYALLLFKSKHPTINFFLISKFGHVQLLMLMLCSFFPLLKKWSGTTEVGYVFMGLLISSFFIHFLIGRIFDLERPKPKTKKTSRRAYRR